MSETKVHKDLLANLIECSRYLGMWLILTFFFSASIHNQYDLAGILEQPEVDGDKLTKEEVEELMKRR
ncbi:unnamed protein product [Caenorhabditis nigoni]